MKRQFMRIILMVMAALAVMLSGLACSSDSDSTEAQSVADGDDSPVIDGDSATDGDWPSDGDNVADGDDYQEDGDSDWTIDGDMESETSWPEDGDAPADGDEPVDGDESVIDGDIDSSEAEWTDGDMEDMPDGDMDLDSDGEEAQPFVCPSEQKPLELYLSSDDSNSVASPVIARSMIMKGKFVPQDRIRIWEFLNYYEIPYVAASDEEIVRIHADMRARPTEGQYALQLAARSFDMTMQDAPPLNLTFVLDTSGSMSGAPIANLKQVCLTVAGKLRAGDTVSMVTWSTSQTALIDGLRVSGPNDETLVNRINSLGTGGGTDLNAGLQAGYRLARQNFASDRLNRVLLISDGIANAGVTDINLIAQNSQDSDEEGIYLVGVSVGEGHNDTLMNAVTDAGRGAYIYINDSDEAAEMFGPRFLENMAIAARAVRMKTTLPWYFVMEEFHGEEYSENPSEIEPQHLAPNDAMVFHQEIRACDMQHLNTEDEIEVQVMFTDPDTRQRKVITETYTLADLLAAGDSEAGLKGDSVVAYAKAFERQHDDDQSAVAEREALQAQFNALWTETGDEDYLEMAQVIEKLRRIRGEAD